MLSKLLLSLLLSIASLTLFSQDLKRIIIVDSLSSEQRKARNPVILRSEMDSMVAAYIALNPAKKVEEQQDTGLTERELYLIIPLALACLLVFLQITESFLNRRRKKELMESIRIQNSFLDRQIRDLTNMKGKFSDQEGKTNADLDENDEINPSGKKFGSPESYKDQYETLARSISKTFKVKNYPRSNGTKNESDILLEFLESEKLFTTNVYEQFVKPIHAILDRNKKAPASISDEETSQLVGYLLSISFLYIEYLYLRITDLSVGGRIVERISDIKSGSRINPAQLKRLDTEHGSKALVLHIALNRLNVSDLPYPVFDETNINKP